MEQEFIARGLAAREEAKCTGQYVSPEEVHGELERMLQNALRDSVFDAQREDDA